MQTNTLVLHSDVEELNRPLNYQFTLFYTNTDLQQYGMSTFWFSKIP